MGSTLPTPATPGARAVRPTIATVLGPLVAEQAALRQTVERQADQLVKQAETIGELRAEKRALLASTAPQSPEPARSHPRPTGASWRHSRGG